MVQVANSPDVPSDAGQPERAEAGSPKQIMNQRVVLLLALPIIGENLLQTAVGAIDTLLVSRIGDDAIAGVGVGAELVFFMLAILSAVTVGATVLVSQAIGSGDQDRSNRLARQAITWGIMIAIPLSIVGYFATPSLVNLFGAEPDVTQYAIEYFEVIAATSVVLLLSFLCGAVLRGAGDSRTPLKAAILANIVNIVLSYALIFGHLGLPELGVAGSAWGASIGRGIAAAFMLVMLWRGKGKLSIHGRSGWRPERKVGKDLFRLGGPAALEQGMMEAGFTLLVAIVATIGTAALAAQQISFTAMSLGFLPAIGFAVTATALVGQSVGARRIDDADIAYRIAGRWSLIWMGAGTILYVIGAKWIIDIFSNDPEVIAAGTSGLRAIGFSLPLWGLWMTSAGALRGAGDTRSPMIRGVLTVWLAVLLAFLGVQFLDMGVGWVWGTFIVTSPIAAVGNMLAYRKKSDELRRKFALDPEPLASPAHQP